MDKYQGIYRVDVKLTDKSDYSFYTRTKRGYDDPSQENFPYAKKPLGDIELEKDRMTEYDDVTENLITDFNQNKKELLYQRYNFRDDNMLDNYEAETDNNNGSRPRYMLRENDRKYNEIVVYEQVKKRTKNRFSGVAVRLLISAALFFGFVGMSKMDNPICQKATSFVKEAITYDLDSKKNKELGEVRAVTLIEEIYLQNDEQE